MKKALFFLPIFIVGIFDQNKSFATEKIPKEIFSKTKPCEKTKISQAKNVNFANPCIESYKINNGGGNCPEIDGVSATGSVTLYFDGPVDPGNIPVLSKVYLINDPSNPVLVTDIFFGPGKMANGNDGDVVYCYYIGPANNNNLQGSNDQFSFEIEFTVGEQCGSVLPIKLGFFNAKRSGGNVDLTWQTLIEVNNEGFYLYRSIGSKWDQIGFISSKAQMGNSTSPLTYQFTDVNNVTGLTQYKFLQKDFDGKTSTSKILMVRGDGQSRKTMIYPNPGSFLRIVFEDGDAIYDVRIIDLSGKQIRSLKQRTNHVEVHNLFPGMYIASVINRETGEQENHKFLIK